MTLISQIITDAFRQSNLISINTPVNTAQSTEALRLFNRVLASVYGFEVGEKLFEFPLGNLNTSRPQGFPFYGNSPPADWFVPVDTRLVCNLTAPTTVYLHPMPDDGARLGMSNPAQNLATNPLTLDSNGRSIEGGESVVLNTNGIARTWTYRQDLSMWMKTSDVLLTDLMPFPEEFDDWFVTMLAMRLNPAYGTQMDQQSVETLKRASRQFKSRYNIVRPTQAELGLQRMPNTTQDRYRWTWNTGGFYDPTASFNAGWPF